MSITAEEYQQLNDQLLVAKEEKYEAIERAKRLQKELDASAQNHEKELARVREEAAIKTQMLTQNMTALIEEREQLEKKLQQASTSPAPPSPETPTARTAPPPPPPSGKPPSVALRQELEKQKADFQKLLEKLSESQQTAAEFQAQLAEERKRGVQLREQLREQSEATSRELRAAEERNQAMQKQLAKAKRQEEELFVKMETQKKHSEIFERESKKTEELRKKVEEIQHENRLLEEKFSLAKQDRDQIQDEIEVIKLEHETTKQALSVTEDLVTQREQEMKELKETHNQSLEELKQEISELHEAADATEADLNREKEGLERQLQMLKPQLEEARNDLKDQRDAVLKEMDKTAREAGRADSLLEELTKQKAEYEKKFTDQELEHKIANKKRNQLVKELKAQLKKETVRAHTIQASLAAAQDELTDLKTRLQSNSPTASSMHEKMGPGSTSSRRSSISSDDVGPPGTSRPRRAKTFADGVVPPPPITPPPNRGIRRTGSVSSGRGARAPSVSAESAVRHSAVEQEVTAALSRKLAQAADENFKLKEKIKFLESTVQDLLAENQKRKRVLENVLRRVETGALTTNDGNWLHRSTLMNMKSADLQKDLNAKMQIVVEETVAENEKLRESKDALGRELSILHDENRHLRNYLAKSHPDMDVATLLSSPAAPEAEKTPPATSPVDVASSSSHSSASTSSPHDDEPEVEELEDDDILP